jgi:hypothetical protein
MSSAIASSPRAVRKKTMSVAKMKSRNVDFVRLETEIARAKVSLRQRGRERSTVGLPPGAFA